MGKQKAPGWFERQGITLVEAIQRFSDEDQAEQWFIDTRWQDGVVCPFCDEMTGVQERKNRKPSAMALQDLPQGLLGKDQHPNARFQALPGNLGHCLLPLFHQPQGR